MATFTSHSPEETLALGEQWGTEAKSGWVIGLSGDLGAGKTQLVKGLARGLGIVARIQSPTFALVNEYHDGRLPLAHLDLYRLDTAEQIIGAGLEDYLVRPPGVAVVEWCERWPEFEAFLSGTKAAVRSSRSALRLVRLAQIAATERRISYEDFGH